MKIKRTILLALTCILLAACLMPALAETVKTTYEDGSLNVRKGPGTNYGVSAWVKNGQEITVLEKGSVWSKIRVNANGKTGYIKNVFIEEDKEENAFVGAVYALACVKTKYASSSVNVRKGPGTQFDAEFKAESGKMMRVLGESGNWYLAEFEDGRTGYISKNYASLGVNAETTAYVNLRTGAGTSFDKITVLPKGASVIARGVTGSWTEVDADGTIGFVFSKYIK